MRVDAAKSVKIPEIAAVGIFSALTFVGGYLFIAVPNVEVFTAMVFLAGMLLGPRNGLLVGLIAQSLYSTINPYGVSPIPLLVAQILNRMLLGFVGGHFGVFVTTQRRWLHKGLILGLCGLLFTWVYDVSTDLSMFFVSGFSWTQIRTTFTLGLPFYLIHGFSNTVIFAFALPILGTAIKKTEWTKHAPAK